MDFKKRLLHNFLSRKRENSNRMRKKSIPICLISTNDCDTDDYQTKLDTIGEISPADALCIKLTWIIATDIRVLLATNW